MFRERWERAERLWLEQWPHGDGEEMEFRLVVRGRVPANRRGTTDDKHRIRQELHPQLRTFWRQHGFLKSVSEERISKEANQFAKYGFRWWPLLPKAAEVACALDVLILRRDEPFRIFSQSGDIDGRVKTLLDGLRMPDQPTELPVGACPSDDEDPFYCLLEDDCQIYEINVTADRLLLPPESNEPHRDVIAIIKVRTKTLSGNVLSPFDHGA